MLMPLTLADTQQPRRSATIGGCPKGGHGHPFIIPLVLSAASMTEVKVHHGLLVQKTMEFYGVRIDSGELLPCSLSNRLRKDLEFGHSSMGSTGQRVQKVSAFRGIDPVAIGDHVHYRDNGDGTGLILGIEQRRSKLSRRAAGKKPVEHVMIANVDQVLVTLSCAEPFPNWNMLDRFLVSAEAENLDATILMTKADLVDPALHEPTFDVYRRCGYNVLVTSVETGDGLSRLRHLLQNRVSVLTGPSGVGKTTLITALIPGLERKTMEVSDRTGKGKHTTRHLELYALPSGGQLADTPGIREFGLWKIAPAHVDHLFPEMHPFIGQCRFGASCRHFTDPGCLVTAAVTDRTIDPRRYESYVKLRLEMEELAQARTFS